MINGLGCRFSRIKVNNKRVEKGRIVGGLPFMNSGGGYRVRCRVSRSKFYLPKFAGGCNFSFYILPI
jgi:hypothetical protein